MTACSADQVAPAWRTRSLYCIGDVVCWTLVDLRPEGGQETERVHCQCRVFVCDFLGHLGVELTPEEPLQAFCPLGRGEHTLEVGGEMAEKRGDLIGDFVILLASVPLCTNL